MPHVNYLCCVVRVMDQHNREVTEMEDLLEQHLTEVHEDHQIKVRGERERVRGEGERVRGEGEG